jgi:hypothetical protein
MKNSPELSKNFNNKLFKEINRSQLFKNIISITIISFLKVFLSIFEVFQIQNSSEKRDKKK